MLGDQQARQEKILLKSIPFEIGEIVYLVSTKQTKKRFGRNTATLSQLGRTVKVVEKDVYTNMWSNNQAPYCMVVCVDPNPDIGRSKFRVHPDDLSTENTYVHPWSELGPAFKPLINKKLSYTASYDCHFLIYKETGKEPNVPLDELYDLMANACPWYDDCYEDEDEGYYDEDDNWVEPEYSTRDTNCHPTEEGWLGMNNSNQACFADLPEMYGRFKQEYGEYPDTMLVNVKKRYVWPEHKPSESRFPVNYLSNEQVLDYCKLLMSAGVFPKDTVMPTEKDIGKDLVVKISFKNTTWDKIFFQCCSLRNIGELPAVAAIANTFHYEGKVDPLMALTLGHVCNPNFYGGHSIMGSVTEYRKGENDIGQPNPDIAECVGFTIASKKLLKKKGALDDDGGWYLDSAIFRSKNKVLRDSKVPKVIKAVNIRQFSSKNRTYMKKG